MADAAEKAVDLAEKWGNAISERLVQAAPGAQDIAIEAVKVKIGSEILGWLLIFVVFLVLARLLRFLLGKFHEASQNERRYQDNEEVPYVIGSIISGVVMLILIIPLLAEFPKREIVGLFAPRG